jgi:cell wall-associated NlpC family hydrolase
MATETHLVEAEFPVLYAASVRTPIAPMHSEPRIGSQMISQQIAGHLVDVLDEEGDWVRARGEDAYEGWMHVGFLARAESADPQDAASRGRVSLGCITETPAGLRRALPLRAILAPDEGVVSGEAIDGARVRERFPFDAASITRAALEYFQSTSYLWGGVTPWGADCSGLVQSVYALHGLQLPRDAWQQAELGEDAGPDIGELQAADLLFFSDRPDRRITHVGIALGKSRMVHLALGRGGYAIDRLSDRSDAYVVKLRERLICARRMTRPAGATLAR